MAAVWITSEQRVEVVNDLVGFIHRVASDKNASPAEVAALPEIARVLFNANIRERSN